MTVASLADIEQAIVDACALDTCSADDVSTWSAENPTRGHCAVAALTLHELFGGDLLCAPVMRSGTQTGYHWWNRVAGIDIDTTRGQFDDDEVIGEPDVVSRPVGKPTNYDEQYLVFSSRVWAALRT